MAGGFWLTLNVSVLLVMGLFALASAVIGGMAVDDTPVGIWEWVAMVLAFSFFGIIIYHGMVMCL